MRTILIIKRGLAISLALSLTAAACGSGAGAGPEPDVRVVATTTIVAEIVGAVTGGRAEIETLIPAGADPHDFRASSRQAAALRSADLVVTNGLGLEQGLDDVIEGAEADGVPVLALAPLLDPIPLAGGSALDPHFWMDPLRVAAAAELVADSLAQIGDGPWRENAEGLATEMETVDLTMVELLAGVTTRRLVTNHDSLGYLASRHAFEIAGVVLPGGGTVAQPSSAELAELVALLEEERIPAIFIDGGLPSGIAEAIAAETSDVVVVELHTTSVGGPGAATIAEMLEETARVLGETLAR